MSEQVLNGEARPGTGGIGRSIGALLAGFFVGAVFSLGTDLGLHAAGVAPALGQPMSEGLLLIATGYRTVYSVISSYVSARLAPNRPMGHALVGGAIGFAISFLGVVINWNHKLGPQCIRLRSFCSRCQPPGLGAGSGSCRYEDALRIETTRRGAGVKRKQEKAVRSTKPSEPEKVDEYIQKLKHPLADVVRALRRIILSTDKEIGEEIKWNAPTFFYAGEMGPSNPKEYKRYLVVFNLYKKDCIRLVFPSGAKVKDRSGLLEGDYADGRRLAMFYGTQDVESKRKVFQGVIKKWLTLLDTD
jgi:hypothetical protein